MIGSLFNGQNLNFTGKTNPFALIQMGGKKKTKKRKYIRKKRKTRNRVR